MTGEWKECGMERAIAAVFPLAFLVQLLWSEVVLARRG
jgi:hypothetical protein